MPAATGAVGVMGGTFDPIHLGHLVAASEVAHRFGLSEVCFVPTGQPWQKSDRKVSDAVHRHAMTLIATASDPRFTVSTVDIDRPGPTYTVDTLRDLRATVGPDRPLAFITGADALNQILTWRDHDEVLRLARLIGVSRPGHRLTPPPEPAEAAGQIVDHLFGAAPLLPAQQAGAHLDHPTHRHHRSDQGRAGQAGELHLQLLPVVVAAGAPLSVHRLHQNCVEA